jgi:hypothetical protein
MERPKPEDSEFYIDHRLAYYSYEKPVEEPSLDSGPDDQDTGYKTDPNPYGSYGPEFAKHGLYGTGQEGFQQNMFQLNAAAREIYSYARGASTLIIIGSIFNDFIHFMILFFSSNFLYAPGVLFGMVGLLISISAFIAAVNLRTLKHMDLVVTIITIYFAFTLIEVIVLPIIMAFINFPPQVILIIFAPVLILSILGFSLTILSRKHYRHYKVEEKQYRQSTEAVQYESGSVGT